MNALPSQWSYPSSVSNDQSASFKPSKDAINKIQQRLCEVFQAKFPLKKFTPENFVFACALTIERKVVRSASTALENGFMMNFSYEGKNVSLRTNQKGDFCYDIIDESGRNYDLEPLSESQVDYLIREVKKRFHVEKIEDLEILECRSYLEKSAEETGFLKKRIREKICYKIQVLFQGQKIFIDMEANGTHRIDLSERIKTTSRGSSASSLKKNRFNPAETCKPDMLVFNPIAEKLARLNLDPPRSIPSLSHEAIEKAKETLYQQLLRKYPGRTDEIDPELIELKESVKTKVTFDDLSKSKKVGGREIDGYHLSFIYEDEGYIVHCDAFGSVFCATTKLSYLQESLLNKILMEMYKLNGSMPGTFRDLVIHKCEKMEFNDLSLNYERSQFRKGIRGYKLIISFANQKLGPVFECCADEEGYNIKVKIQKNGTESPLEEFKWMYL